MSGAKVLSTGGLTALAAATLACLVLAVAPNRTEAGAPPPAHCPAIAGSVDVTKASIQQIRAALLRGSVTSRQLTETYLARIAAVNRTGPKLNAVIMTAPDALAQADAADQAIAAGESRGRLAGVPILIKDNLDTHDMPTTAGAKAMLGDPPPTDAFVTARLRAAGAVILGKANMSEWATAIAPRAGLGFSNVGGRLANPYGGYNTSGSSNGSAIAASSSLAAGTVGSETQGSIVLPSFINSAAGIKPTLGLVSRGGVVPLIPTFDTPGPIARDLSSAALMLGLMTGIDPRDPATRSQRGHVPRDYQRFLRSDGLKGARIGVTPNVGEGPTDRILGKGRITKTLARQGATVLPIPEDLADAGAPSRGGPADFKQGLNRYLEERGPTSPMKSLAEVIEFNRAGGKAAIKFGQEFLLDAEAVSRADEVKGPKILKRFRAETHRVIERAMNRHDLDAILVPRVIAAITATSAGHPHVTVQAGYLKGRPFGMVLVGRRWSEGKLISYGSDFEKATRAYRSPARFNPAFATACSR
ncbi:MAG TPA: amidase family protein [Solirubrobacterales bacterium]|nr:amidase family protein [Solirubrobacterales bacterium]